jgi:two-component system, chemotaxis family, chemotaxis protein CheY
MKKILIVDDAVFMRVVIKDVLTTENYELIEAENGREALEKIETEKPDLVLLDIIMPDMDGIAVLQKIGVSTKVIVISSVGQEVMIKEAKRLGAMDYILKPLDVSNDKEKVLSSIKNALN